MNRQKIENLLQTTDHLANYAEISSCRYLHAIAVINETIASVKFDAIMLDVKIIVFNPKFTMRMIIDNYDLLAAVIPRLDALITKDNRICWYAFGSHLNSICPGSVEWLNLGKD